MDRRQIQSFCTSLPFGSAHIHLYCFAPSTESPAPSAGFRQHSHFYYECHLLTRGAFSFCVDGKNVDVSQSQLLVIPPFADHRPFYTDKADNLVFAITLEQAPGEDGAYRYFSQAFSSLALKPLTLPDSLISQIQTFAFLRSAGSMGDLFRRKAAAYAIIGGLLDCLEKSPDTPLPAETELESTLFLLEHLINDTQHSLSEIGQILGYSPRHTARLIQNLYGKSFRQIRRIGEEENR